MQEMGWVTQTQALPLESWKHEQKYNLWEHMGNRKYDMSHKYLAVKKMKQANTLWLYVSIYIFFPN